MQGDPIACSFTPLCPPGKGPACPAGHSSAVCIKRYRPPFEEFEVRCVVVSKDQGLVSLPADEGPQIILVGQGAGRAVARCGSVATGPENELCGELEIARGVRV